MESGMTTAPKNQPPLEKKPRIAGIAGTIVFWLLFILVSTVFSLFARKPVYKSVQIRLDSAQAQEARAAAAPKAESTAKEASKAAPAPSPAREQAMAQSSQPAKSSSKTKTAQKESAAVKTAAPAKAEEKFEPQFYDPMEQFNKNTAKPQKKKTAAEIDWDNVPDSSTSSASSEQSSPATVKEVDALQGSAAKAADGRGGATLSSPVKESAPSAASSGTGTALEQIASQSKVNGGGLSTESADTANRQTNGNSDIRFTSGAGRKLLSDPGITLSPEAQKSISGEAHMQISFTVRADGTVTDIQIPRYLPAQVRTEIEQKISKWRFSSGSSNDTATFNYRIKE